MGWIALLILLCSGAVAWRWLVQVEKEIRSEIETGSSATPETESDQPVRSVPVDVATGTLAEKIVDVIRQNPGVLQKELYARLSGYDRRQVQKELLDLDHSGKICRARSGSTYKLTLTV